MAARKRDGKMLRFVRPEEKYVEQFLEAMQESYDNDVREWLPLLPVHYDMYRKIWKRFYQILEDGSLLPENVPASLFRWAIEDEVFIGQYGIAHQLSEEKAMELGHISYAVRHSKWRQGYGYRILSEAIRHCHTLGISPVYIAVHPDNSASVHLIEKCGFRFFRELIDANGVVVHICRLEQDE